MFVKKQFKLWRSEETDVMASLVRGKRVGDVRLYLLPVSSKIHLTALNGTLRQLFITVDDHIWSQETYKIGSPLPVDRMTDRHD